LRIFSARYFFTASFCLALSLLTRSASISGGGGTPCGKGFRSLLKVDRGDLYRSEKIMVVVGWSTMSPLAGVCDGAEKNAAFMDAASP
jgi:hypothetical protein